MKPREYTDRYYRTPRLSSKYLDGLGTTHFHMDLPKIDLEEELKKFLKALERQGFKSEYYPVDNFIRGSQRDNPSFTGAYLEHTPGGAHESFVGFSTTRTPRRSDLIEVINMVPDSLRGRGIVGEAEQVIAVGSTAGTWRTISGIGGTWQTLRPDEAKITHNLTPEYEIHHGAKVRGRKEPISLEELASLKAITAGGWFYSSFPQKRGADVYEYSSNALAHNRPDSSHPNLTTVSRREAGVIQELFRERGFHINVGTVIEAVLVVGQLE